MGYALRVDSAVRAMNFSSIQVTDPGLALFLFQENNVISLREQLAAEPYTSKTYPLEPSGGGWHKYFIDLELATTPPQARVDIDGVPGTPIALSMKFRRSNITIRAGVPFAAADAGPDNVHIDELVLCEDP